MFTLRTRTDLTAHDVRRLMRHGYDILAIKTDHQTDRDHHTIVWARETGIFVPNRELPF